MIWLKGSTIGTAMLLLLGVLTVNLSAQETPPPVTQDTVQMIPETTKVDTLKMEPAPIVPPVPVETAKVAPPPIPDTIKKAPTQMPATPKARQNHNIMMDLLKNAAGIEILDAGQFLARPAIRGVFGSRVLLLQDGVRMNTFRDFPLWGTSPTLIDVDQVEKIEILNGPGSHLYGSDAYGGVINFITPKPEFLPGGEMENGYDLSGSYKFSYSSIGEQKKNRLELKLADKKWALNLGGSFRKVPHNYKSGGENEQVGANTSIKEESSVELNLGYKFR